MRPGAIRDPEPCPKGVSLRGFDPAPVTLHYSNFSLHGGDYDGGGIDK